VPSALPIFRTCQGIKLAHRIAPLEVMSSLQLIGLMPADTTTSAVVFKLATQWGSLPGTKSETLLMRSNSNTTSVISFTS
jgi:hypothetical protein